MKLVKQHEIIWTYMSDWHNMRAGTHPKLPNNSSADIIFAEIAPGQVLGCHYHNRPLADDGSSDGYESFFFFQGGCVILINTDEEISICTPEPFTVTYESGHSEAHGIRNVGAEPVVFQVVCAPRFVQGEEVLI